MSIQAVVFDFGGVLFDWNPEYLYQELIPDTATRHYFLSEVCSTKWIVAQDAGKPCREATEELVAQHPEHESLIRAFHARWTDMLRGAFSDSVDLLETLHHAEVPLYGLTNWSAETFPYAWDHYPFLRRFRDIVVSGRERVAKPDAAIYQILQRRIAQHLPQLTSQDIVFIDDNRYNVEAAQRLGWQAIQHHDACRTRAQLQTLGLPL